MRNILKKSLLFLAACLLAGMANGTTIYSTDIVANPTGASAAGNKGSFTSSPSWASGYSNCFATSGSAGAVTITFNSPLNLSGYSNCKLTLVWGAESNRPVNITINGGTATQIDNINSSADRSKVRTATNDISETSISSIKISGSGGGQSYYFHIEISGDGEGGGDTPGGGEGGGDTPGGGEGGGDTPGGDTPGTEGTVIFDWTKVGSTGFDADMTDLSDAAHGTMTVGTSIYGRKLGENNADNNNKGYKLGYNDLCIEIQGISDFAAGDIVTIKGVCGGSGDRAFTVAPESAATPSSSDAILTNTQANTSETLEYTATLQAAQAGSKIRIFRMAGKTMYLSAIKVTRMGPAGPSSDATLKSLKYNGTSVPNFSPATLSYNVELPAGTTTVPTVTAEANDTKANTEITPATSLPGTTTVKVTAENGTEKNYTIQFTVATSFPKVLTATWTNIAGSATIDEANKTITGKVSQGTGLTSITPNFTGNNISSWTPQGAQNFTNPVTYTFTNSATGEQTTYTVTITEVPVVHPTGVTLDQTTLSLQVNGSADLHATVQPSDATDPSVSWTSSNTGVATVNNGHVSAVGEGTATITVKTTDGNKSATCTVTVTAGKPIPPTSLTMHQPEIYEEKEIAGGYGGTLSVFGGREYEVYYSTFDDQSHYQVAVTPSRKVEGITYTTNDNYSCKSNDGWLEVKGSSSKSDFSMPQKDEFQAGESGCHKIYNNGFYQLHIKGYDQFSFFGKDNSTTIDPNNASKNKRFQVYIDGELQPETQVATEDKIRRYDITTGEHLIEVRGIGSSNNYFYGFSLRLAQEPRVKYQKGNDTTQTIKQTEAIKPVVYTAKYNNISGAETRLEWIGAEATGIILRTTAGSLSDTLTLSGTANCPVGNYTYALVAYYNTRETNRVTGTFSVKSDIQTTSDLEVEAYQNEAMDPILFRYYALSEDDVLLTWPNGQPQGITGSGNNGKYTIGGTPTTTGVYPFSITVTGADTTFTGKITVKYLDYGDNAVLYLHKNNQSYENDPVYKHLISSAGGKKNLITRKALNTGLRPAEQYANYKWIFISEDADADNEEVLAVVRGGANLPVLNMKGFTYAENRLGWGYPDNGSVDSITHNGRNIFVYREDHPIFKKFNLHTGDKLPVFDTVARNGIMPITINGEVMAQTLCLATGYTRNIDDYNQDGALQTAIHEIPAAMRGGKKYICMPMAIGAASQLTPQGKSLIDAIVSYLTDENAPVLTAPILQMNSFSIMGVAGNIDQTNNTIDMAFDITQFPDLDLSAVVPTITLEDPAFTFVTPASGETVNFQYSSFMPVKFIISDYISTRTYNVTVRTYDPQGIEQVYEAGQWVNIFDIFGRMIATTNEDIYTMDLPHGMYLVVTENGQTIKLMR